MVVPCPLFLLGSPPSYIWSSYWCHHLNMPKLDYLSIPSIFSTMTHYLPNTHTHTHTHTQSFFSKDPYLSKLYHHLPKTKLPHSYIQFPNPTKLHLLNTSFHHLFYQLTLVHCHLSLRLLKTTFFPISLPLIHSFPLQPK